MYKENIFAAYNVSDIEIEEPSPLYDGDTKNKAEEVDRLHAAMKEKLVTASNTEKNKKYRLWFLILGHESVVLKTLEFQSI